MGPIALRSLTITAIEKIADVQVNNSTRHYYYDDRLREIFF